jgi:hypothetical protein
MVILSALRPDGPEASEADFAEALALAERDPALKAWWKAQREFDRKVAAKLAEVPLPEDLRETILASRKIEPFRPRASYSTWLAIAAMVAFLCVAGTFWEVSTYGPVDREDYAQQILPMLGNDSPHLAMTTPDHDKITAWLKSQHAPVGEMPAKFAAMPSLGCQKYDIHGHTVSLVCFGLENGGEAHLFIVDRSALNDPPEIGRPRFDTMQGWNVASWSDGKMSYLLATHASPDELKQLLSIGRDPRPRGFAGSAGKVFPGSARFASR